VYNPEETLFMRKGIEVGTFVKNGEQMLHLQADKALTIWNKHKL
jgi:shikimate dehydrogenase